MALARVPIDHNKAAFVKALRAKDNGTGLFSTHADILTFAAAIGFRHRKRVPIGRIIYKDPDPVLQEQFRNPLIISLIAVADTPDPKILASDDDSDRLRVQIFQEYANGGLEIMQRELYGIEEPCERTLLILYTERQRKSVDDQDFDVSQLF